MCTYYNKPWTYVTSVHQCTQHLFCINECAHTKSPSVLIDFFVHMSAPCTPVCSEVLIKRPFFQKRGVSTLVHLVHEGAQILLRWASITIQIISSCSTEGILIHSLQCSSGYTKYLWESLMCIFCLIIFKNLCSVLRLHKLYVYIVLCSKFPPHSGPLY